MFIDYSLTNANTTYRSMFIKVADILYRKKKIYIALHIATDLNYVSYIIPTL